MLLDCRLLHICLTDINSVCGRLLGLTPATRRYKAHSYVVNNHEVTILTKRDSRRGTQRNTLRDTRRSHGEAICALPPVFSRIRNSKKTVYIDYLSVKYIVTLVREQRGDPYPDSRVNPEDLVVC